MRALRAKLFHWGFRAQPLHIRRGISLLLAIGMEWDKQNKGMMERVMRGEHLNLEGDFRTVEVADDGAALPPSEGAKTP